MNNQPNTLLKDKGQIAALVAWVGSLAATLGSLYFSLILELPPCDLCWYQRIAMYPLVFIIAVGILFKDKKMFWYSFPLVVVGWLIAIYHNLLYHNILPESAAPCKAGISCTTELLKLFGFLDIPMMSLIGFTFIGIVLLLYKRWTKNSSAIAKTTPTAGA